MRFVLSFRPLPDDLVRLRGEAQLPEVLEPLRLYELRDPLPRAFRAKRLELVPDRDELQQRLSSPVFDPRAVALVEAPPDAPPGRSAPASEGPGEVRYGSRTPTPYASSARSARMGGGPRRAPPRLEGLRERQAPCAPAGRWPISGGGDQRGGEVLTLRYEPSWRKAALLACALGAVLAVWPGPANRP